MHHIKGEGEARGFEMEAMVVDFLFSVRQRLLGVRNRGDTYPNILIDLTSPGEVPDHAARSFQAALTCFVEPWGSSTLFALVNTGRWVFILLHDPISSPSRSKDEERTECEKQRIMVHYPST